MAEPHSIAPFPLDIDRNSFGHWLSGFTDGEGHFGLGSLNSQHHKGTPYARFIISLRADDTNVLNLTRSFLGCGNVRYSHAPSSAARGYSPKGIFYVHSIVDIYLKVVPHFRQFPLRAKKARDFVIWSEAVALLFEIKTLPHARNSRRNRYSSHWSETTKEKFLRLKSQIESQRHFNAAEIPPVPEPPSLFDGL